jgi:hypothetical protein
MKKINLKFLSGLKKGILSGSGERDYVFIFLALFMLITVSVLVIWCVTFLIANLTDSFVDTTPPPAVEKFDIEGFEELNLIR